MHVEICEQETTITIARDGRGARIWSSDTVMIAKLDKLCKTSPENYRLEKIGYFEDGSIANKFYFIADKDLLKFRARKRVLSEEQKAAYAERFNGRNEKTQN